MIWLHQPNGELIPACLLQAWLFFVLDDVILLIIMQEIMESGDLNLSK